MIVFDFEVFKYDWCVVFKDIINDEYTVIKNSKEELEKFYEKNKNNLLIGYNNSGYDNYILKCILLGEDPYHLTTLIFKGDNRINNYCNWKDKPLITYDVMFGLGYTSLKENEAYLGISIDECSVDFKKADPLTDEEWDKVIDYCKKDVDATQLLFAHSKDAFETKLYLLNEFNLDKSYLTKPDQTIIERILGATRRVRYYDDTDPFDFSQLNLKINKYSEVIDFYSEEYDYGKGLALDICGVHHTLGIGGIHGAINNFEYDGKLMLIDVASYYPSMIVEYDWFARSVPDVNKKLYSKMKKDRGKLKKTNPKLSSAYKLVLNTTYGCFKYAKCNLLDKRMANNICIGGQVMLVDLMENLEPYCKLVQSNTDGIIIIPTDEEKIIEVVKDWEERTRMEMEITYASNIVQKDVNNYVMKTDDGKIKTAGSFVSQYNGQRLRRTMSIVDKALVEYLINGVLIEDYIMACNDPLDFQIISKVGKTYDKVFYINDQGVKVDTNFVNRAYVGYNSGKLYKQKVGKNPERVANHPDTTFIFNDDLSLLDMSKVDKNWYINMARSRLQAYKGEGKK